VLPLLVVRGELLEVQLFGLERDVVVHRERDVRVGGGVEVALVVLGGVELQDAVENDFELRVGVPELVQRLAARVGDLVRAGRTDDLPRGGGGERAARGGCGWGGRGRTWPEFLKKELGVGMPELASMKSKKE